MRVLACIHDYDPSSVINVITPLTHLHDRGMIEFEHRLENEVRPWHIGQCDILVACRNLEGIYRPIFELASQYQIPIIYDLDDNLLNVPRADANNDYYHHPTRQAQLKWMLYNSDLVRVHSPFLKMVVFPYNQRLSLVRASVDFSLIPEQLPTLAHNPIHIVYATSRTKHDNLFALILPDLKSLLEHYRERVRLHMLGYKPAELEYYSNLVHKPFEKDYRKFFTEFTHFGYAIGLAPMVVDDFHMAKTNTKYRDYAAAGAAGLYSDCSLYGGDGGVIHGETGILVPVGAGRWIEAISSLIENPSQIETIRRNARAALERDYSLDAFAQGWLHDLQAVFHPRERAEIPRDQKWWFNRNPTRISGLASRGRHLYRAVVPTKWRVRFLDFRNVVRTTLYHWLHRA